MKKAAIIWVSGCLFLGLWGNNSLHAATFYKWRDKKGVIHLSDTPPMEGSYTIIQEGDTQSQKGSVSPQKVQLNKPKKRPIPLRSIKIPLKRWGNHFLLRLRLDHQVDGTFILDTGASLTLISPRIAKQVGIPLDSSLPFLPIKTASGIILPPVVEIDGFYAGKIKLSGAKEVVVHDLRQGEGIDGLVGMDILSDYQVTLETRQGLLILKPLRGMGPVYGGHPRQWWTRRFTFYAHAIHNLEQLLKEPPKTLEAFHVTRQRVEESITFFRGRLIDLKLKAEDDLVPLDWRRQSGG